MTVISIVVPVYKAESCLSELYRRVVASVEDLCEDFEILLVEDCGGDHSWEIIQELAKNDPRVRGLKFSRNFGQHYGITAGLDHCRGDWAVVMDCDLQDRPEEIPRLYAKAQEGYDVVLARRGKRKDGLVKRTTSMAFYRVLSYLAGTVYDPEVGNFRIISRKVINSYREMREKLRFFGGLVDWMGYPTGSVDVEHAERFEGQSSYTFWKLWKLATETIIAHSDKPLHLAIRFGFATVLFSFGFGLYVIYKAVVYGSPVLGWSSLMVSVYFLGGIIILILGIIGIYLGKTFDETKKRPLYLVREQTFED